MAPELAHCDDYDPQNVDVWSLGIIIFVLLTGSSLIADERKSDSVYRIICCCGIRQILHGVGTWRAYARP